ncbi:hypothetical protein D3C71_2114290 [compost metagenome]
MNAAVTRPATVRFLRDMISAPLRIVMSIGLEESVCFMHLRKGYLPNVFYDNIRENKHLELAS